MGLSTLVLIEFPLIDQFIICFILLIPSEQVKNLDNLTRDYFTECVVNLSFKIIFSTYFYRIVIRNFNKFYCKTSDVKYSTSSRLLNLKV